MDIQEILKKYSFQRKQGVPNSERADIVKKFVVRLNEGRVSGGYKPLPAKFYAIKMAQSGLKTNHDLYWFYAYCNETKNFNKTWWWSLRTK